MDSLQRYEMSHCDALRPLQQGSMTSFMGEHLLTQPATCNDLHQFMSWVVSAINTSLSAHVASFPATRRPISEPERAPAHVASFHASRQPISEPEQAPVPLPSPELADPSVVATNTAASPAFANVRIPDIPRGPGNWRKAVEQWDTLLKSWPEEYYTGAMRTVTGTKRRMRQVIADEYDR
jgi:hypothetical protein